MSNAQIGLQGNGQVSPGHNAECENKLDLQNPTESERFQSHLQMQLNQISHPIQEIPHNNMPKFQNAFSERDFDFVSSTIFISAVQIVSVS